MLVVCVYIIAIIPKINVNLSEVIRKSLEEEVASIQREIRVKKIKNLSERFRNESPSDFLMVNKNEGDSDINFIMAGAVEFNPSLILLRKIRNIL